ncbi:MAG: hypothetical protein K0A95_09330, partial [Chromatiales bacterium]|nr:hypothetical protein [Chromatiales bacterium]
MQSYTPLQLSEQENFDIDESHVLRYGPSGISFHNRDHDLSNYVHSTVPTATNAFWLDKKQQLLVQSESHELHLLDINAKLLMETESLGAEVKEVGVIDVVDEDGVKGVVGTILLARTDEHLMVISLK